MKHLTSQIALIISLSVCLVGMAQDKDDEDEKDVAFSVKPHIANINCGGTTRNATFTVKNQEEHATIFVDPEALINYDNFPDDLVTIQPADAVDSLTTCDDTYLKPGGTCNVNLLIQPADCSQGIILGHIHRKLVVEVGTMQDDVSTDIKFAYTALGAGDDFAILGNTVSNESSSYGDGPVTAVGSVGFTEPLSMITGKFNVTDGTFYGAFGDDDNPAVVAAQNDFTSIYQMFIISMNASGCTGRSGLDNKDKINIGSFCFYDNGNEISVDGEITLTGTSGTYVFFVGTNATGCFNPLAAPSQPTACNITFRSNTRFVGDPSPNIYWVIGDGTVTLSSGAVVTGSILSQGPINGDDTGVNPAAVNGRLWSNSAITLYGNSVKIHP